MRRRINEMRNTGLSLNSRLNPVRNRSSLVVGCFARMISTLLTLMFCEGSGLSRLLTQRRNPTKFSASASGFEVLEEYITIVPASLLFKLYIPSAIP